MIDTVTRRLQFTKLDRYLIQNQTRPFTLSTRHPKSSESSDFDMEEIEEFLFEPSAHREKLLQGAITDNHEVKETP